MTTPQDDPTNVPPLDPELLALLRCEGNDLPVPSGARSRVRARLAASVVALGAVGAIGAATSGGLGIGAAAGAKTGLGALVSGLLRGRWFALGTFGAGAALGAAVHASLVKPETHVVYVDRPVAARPADPPPLAAPPPTSIELEPSPPGRPVVAPPAARAASTVASAGPAIPRASSQLAAERTLLDSARGALAQGDPSRALEKLDQHRRTFAAPVLADERDAMSVQALVKAGRPEDARAAAEAFKKRAPGSLFLPMVDAAIGSIPRGPSE